MKKKIFIILFVFMVLFIVSFFIYYYKYYGNTSNKDKGINKEVIINLNWVWAPDF